MPSTVYGVAPEEDPATPDELLAGCELGERSVTDGFHVA